MTRDFFNPTPEEQNVVLIEAAVLQKAQRLIADHEACSVIELVIDYLRLLSTQRIKTLFDVVTNGFLLKSPHSDGDGTEEGASESQT